MRRLISIPLVVIGALLIALGSLTWWAHRQVFNADRVVAAANSALAEPAVQQLLLDELTDDIVDQIGDESRRPQVTELVRSELAHPDLPRNFAAAVREVHAEIVAGAAPLATFNLVETATRVRAQLVAVIPELDATLPAADTALEFGLVEPARLPQVWGLAERIHDVAPIIVLLGIALCALGVLLGPSRWALLVVAGVVLAVLSLASMAAVRSGLNATTGQVDNATTRAAIDTFSDPFLQSLTRQSVIFTVAGAVVALIGAVLGVLGAGSSNQRGWKPPASYRRTNWS